MTLIKEYNDNTTLHGFKYITEYGQKAIEKVFWCLIVLAAIVFGVYLTNNILDRYIESPIIGRFLKGLKNINNVYKTFGCISFVTDRRNKF